MTTTTGDTTAEIRDAEIARREAAGLLDSECGGCREFYVFYRERWTPGADLFAPSHKPSSRCRSGSRPHCTCDTCF